MPEEHPALQLIVIGSSAGGIEALTTLVSTIPTPFPAPIVIAQHLDPSRPSHLGEILSRRSTLPVVTVREHEQIQPGTIYVVPADHHIEVTDHEITLQPHDGGRPKPSIDLLLTSASEVYGERLVAVILTGTGSDGALGARAVKQAGGTVVIQNPNTAAYPGMPRAVEPNIVDIVADLPRIAPILFDLITGVAVPSEQDAERDVFPFLDTVRQHTGIDFSSYKTPTILRRLQRRIIAVSARDLDGYMEYLRKHPDEYQRLASSFLIKVTDFMRDAELFDVLRDDMIPEMVAASRASGNELRFWSAGCATGQEAYSLAILVMEALGDELPNFTIKIFATDLDNEAIAFARHGLYPETALDHMPDDLLARYFTPSGTNYEVKKQVRSLVVFGEHDLAARAPFPRIDMVLCRNVLIYFTRELQQRALQLFAFSLRPGGYLVLGKTETVSPTPDFFTPEALKLKVYKRQGKERPLPPFHIQSYVPQSMSRSGQRLPSGRERQRGMPANRELFQAQQESLQARVSKENLLLNLPIGVVVVDRHYDILEINSAARRLLGIHTVAISEDLLHLTQNVPNKEFRAAIDRAFRENTVSHLGEVQVPQMTTGEPAYLRIGCYPRVENSIREAGAKAGEHSMSETVESVLVLVNEVTDMIQARRDVEQSTALLSSQTEELRVANTTLAANNAQMRNTNASLEEAHQTAKEQAVRHAQQIEVLAEANSTLLAANQELTTANSELRSTLDDFLVTNEEAQAAIEEVETLNEEMQATNEELETLNEELQATVEELNTSNSDMAARGEELQSLSSTLEVQKTQLETILSSLTDAVLVINSQGKPLLMNDAYKLLFGSDQNQISSLTMMDEHSLPLSPADGPQARVARGETFTMTFTLEPPSTGERRWLEAVGQPVLGAHDEKWGVMVVRDITERSLRVMQEQFTSLASHELRTPLTAINGYLQMLKLSLKESGNERQNRYVEVALAQANKQKRLIEDLLDVARLQNGKFALQREPLRLDSLLEQAVDAAQVLSKGQQIELTIDNNRTSGRAAGSSGGAADVGGPMFVDADAVRLEQAVLNLVTNAIEYAPESSRIDVRLCRAEGMDMAMAEINVQDYGKGIESKDLSEVFTRFYQVREGKSLPTQGLGLGLFITNQIVEAHGGTISVESTVGQGATFIIRLPLLEQKSEDEK